MSDSKLSMDGPGTITWEEFFDNAESLVEASNKISDGWELRGNKNMPAEAYLVRRTKQYISQRDGAVQNCFALDNENDFDFGLPQDPFATTFPVDIPLVTEHHVLWSMSYSVPVLYFNGWKSDFQGINPVSVEEAQKLCHEFQLRYGELSQAIHPILGIPFLQLHPCMSRELLQVTNKSKNKLISWLSTVAPAALFLKIRPEYCEMTL